MQSTIDLVVPTTGLDPMLDYRLSQGARALLVLLRALAAPDRTVTAQPKALASRLGCSTASLWNYRADLVATGYITQGPTDLRSHLVTITILADRR